MEIHHSLGMGRKKRLPPRIPKMISFFFLSHYAHVFGRLVGFCSLPLHTVARNTSIHAPASLRSLSMYVGRLSGTRVAIDRLLAMLPRLRRCSSTRRADSNTAAWRKHLVDQQVSKCRWKPSRLENTRVKTHLKVSPLHQDRSSWSAPARTRRACIGFLRITSSSLRLWKREYRRVRGARCRRRLRSPLRRLGLGLEIRVSAVRYDGFEREFENVQGKKGCAASPASTKRPRVQDGRDCMS
jgi:hypothetical protein